MGDKDGLGTVYDERGEVLRADGERLLARWPDRKAAVTARPPEGVRRRNPLLTRTPAETLEAVTLELAIEAWELPPTGEPGAWTLTDRRLVHVRTPDPRAAWWAERHDDLGLVAMDAAKRRAAEWLAAGVRPTAVVPLDEVTAVRVVGGGAAVVEAEDGGGGDHWRYTVTVDWESRRIRVLVFLAEKLRRRANRIVRGA